MSRVATAEKKIKVCMLSCNHPPEDDRIYWKESLTLQNNGYDVIHISIGDENLKYTSESGITLIQLQRTPHVNKFLRILRPKKGIYQKILNAAIEEKADVYHFHDWQLNIIGKALKNLPHHPKIIYDAHEATADFLRQKNMYATNRSFIKNIFSFFYVQYVKYWENKCVRRYDAVITAEEYAAAEFKRNNPTTEVVIIHNFSYFEPIKPEMNVPKIFDLVYSGTITRERGILELLESIYIIKKNIPRIKTIIIGEVYDPDFKEILTKRISSLKLQENIVLHPFVPFNEINNYYVQSKIGICIWHLTKKNLNAIPIKIFEYMAFGLPVIFSNKGFAIKFIEETSCGILVNPHSAEEIATAISRLLNETSLYDQLRNNGLKAISSDYNWRKESEKLLKLYKKIYSVL